MAMVKIFLVVACLTVSALAGDFQHRDKVEAALKKCLPGGTSEQTNEVFKAFKDDSKPPQDIKCAAACVIKEVNGIKIEGQKFNIEEELKRIEILAASNPELAKKKKEIDEGCVAQVNIGDDECQSVLDLSHCASAQLREAFQGFDHHV